MRVWKRKIRLEATQLENKQLDLGVSLEDLGLELFSVQKSSREQENIIYKQDETVKNILELGFKESP